MSLILEALRKSEAERRRGASPDLRVELPPTASRARRAIAPWPLLAVVVVLVFSAGLWWRARPTAPVATTPAATDASHSASNASPTSRSRPPYPASVRDGAGDTASDATFPVVQRIDPSTPPGNTESRGVTEPVQSIQAPDGIAATGSKPDAGAAAVNVTADGAAAARHDSEAGLSLNATPATPAAAIMPPAAVVPARTPSLPSSPPSAGAGGVEPLSSLSPAERRRLPAMKLSMHMWNAEPSRRFVIIDGTRFVEGDRIGEAVVTRIDPDGVMLDLDGRTVRMPLR